MTDADRALRNEQIVGMRAAGLTWREIADEVEMSYSQVRQIVRNYEDAGRRLPIDALHVDPHEILAEVITDQRDSLRQLARIGARADNDSAAVGALKARAVVSVNLLRVLAFAGLAPPTPLQWQADRDLKRIGLGIHRALGAFEERVAGLAEDGAARDRLLEALEEFRDAYLVAVGLDPEETRQLVAA
jgi:DNA-binding Lrp family transcriptional regulator